MRTRVFYIGLILLVMLWFLPELADAQCAMCNATASTGKEGNKESAQALNNGILFLMAIPYLLLASMVLIWWRYRKQKKAEQAAGQ